jgi:hypothetical protein
MSLPTIILDADDVLVEWRKAFHAFMKKNGFVPRKPAHEDDCWHFRGSFANFDADRHALEWIRRFAVSKDYERIPQVPGALDGVRALRSRYGHLVRFACVTSAGSDPRTLEMRRRQLAPFELDSIEILDIREGKADRMRALNGVLLLDDHLANLHDARSIGMQAIVYDRAYNRDAVDFPRVRDWNQAFDAISAFIERLCARRDRTIAAA